MQNKTIDYLTRLLLPKDKRSIVQWAESPDGIYFANVPSYDCSYRRPFSISLLPFWKEILDNITDRNCREQVIVKNARAGGSMTVLETALRYTIAVAPQSTLFISGS